MTNKKFSFIIILMLLLVSCGSIEPASTIQDNKQTNKQVSTNNTYTQYIGKTWLITPDTEKKFGGGYMSIRIEKIDSGGNVKGIIYSDGFDKIPDETINLESAFTGTILDDTAECQFKTQNGNKGKLSLVFLSADKMQATISLISKTETAINSPQRVFEFEPDNINNEEGFKVIEDRSFMVDLDSWGYVRFAIGELTGGSHGPVLCLYLTDENGDILYDFFNSYACDLYSELLYAENVNDVCFEDVNQDGLKDFIIIVTTKKDEEIKHSGEKIASVYLQDADGKFANDAKLEEEINDSCKEKDMKTVKAYFNKKFNS